jgi:glycosyltransferase involved in cell wall biosynthesis
MKISVVIPLYNKELSIQRAINSVLNQTEQDFEIVVVNDGSTDKSAQLVEDMADDRIRLIHQENAGVSVARNRGVSEARSELIAFLDADDEWEPCFINTILELQYLFPQEAAYATSYWFQKNDGEKYQSKCERLFSTEQRFVIADLLKFLRVGLPFNSSSFAVKKNVFHEIGGFEPGIKYKEDVEFWIRLSLSNNIAFNKTPLAIYHLDSENRACNIFDNKVEQSYPVIKLIGLMQNDELPSQYKQSAIEYIAKYQLPLAKHYILKNEMGTARSILNTLVDTKVYKHEWLFAYACSFLPFPVMDLLSKTKIWFRELNK